MARTEGIEGEGRGSHHFTEEGLWREQTAWGEDGHITRDWSIGHSRVWRTRKAILTFGLHLDFEEGKYQVFQDSYLALRWKFLFQV